MAKTSSRRPGTAAVIGTAAGVLVWSTLIERRLFTIRRHTVPVLPAGAAPLRVLQLSDLHLAPWQVGKINWVRSLRNLNPDLLVLTGDLMGHTQARPALLNMLEAFSDVPAVFVHGSNDYYGPRFKNPLRYLKEPSRLATREQDIDNAALTHGLEGLGFIDLNNAATTLELRGTELELFGLGDPHIKLDDEAKMREARESLGASDAAVRIGVVHAPYQAALNSLLEADASLLLAGHTHGGQVRVPGVGSLTANCDLPNRQSRGLSVWYNAHTAAYLNVSAGLGNSIYAPVRFACKPEASLITLTAPEIPRAS
ncbi:metallophosphoesterase [Leucobacter denitrificans]|uniref:Metallophosphoesterase n=1 Tax=Leucobacter denitrificans TaxID=683042 RepID=A0A7G9S750_9MICO|nr:metallophosphoesterase [Leucobacter denitrificans]QNN63675.1 metallophosphoesterase [Leucobacter denitrificans]